MNSPQIDNKRLLLYVYFFLWPSQCIYQKKILAFQKTKHIFFFNFSQLFTIIKQIKRPSVRFIRISIKFHQMDNHNCASI